MTTQTIFEQFPKEEQNYRWALFLLSNGYKKELNPEVIQLAKKYFVDLKKPLYMSENGDLPKFKNWCKETA